MPVLDEGARVRPGLWPNLGVVTIYPDTCRESASLLEGEQNIDLPRVGSEQCAAQLAPQMFPFSPFPPDTLVRENPPGEGAAIERRATEDLRPERLKPPDAQAEDQREAGGVPSIPGESPVALEVIDPFGSAGMAENADAGEVEPSGVDTHERGGALLVVGTAPTLAEGTAGVEPTGEAERATAAKSEALAPRTQGEARWGRRDAAEKETSRRMKCCRRRASANHRR